MTGCGGVRGERRLLRRRPLQNRDHAIDNVLACRVPRKLNFLTRVFFPIAFGMFAMALNQIGAMLLLDAPGEGSPKER